MKKTYHEKVVKKSFWCKIGFHKLVVVKTYLRCSDVECIRPGCNFKGIEIVGL